MNDHRGLKEGTSDHEQWIDGDSQCDESQVICTGKCLDECFKYISSIILLHISL